MTTTQQVVPQQPPVRAIGAHEVPRECFLTPTASLPQPQTDCDVMCMRKAAAANSVCAATSPASAVRGPAAGPDSVRAATCPASAVGAAGPGSATSTIRASANAAPATDGIRFFRNIGDVSLLITDCFPDHGVFPGARTPTVTVSKQRKHQGLRHLQPRLHEVSIACLCDDLGAGALGPSIESVNNHLLLLRYSSVARSRSESSESSKTLNHADCLSCAAGS